MTRRTKIVAIVYGVILALTCIGCISWPNDLPISLPVAAVFGPFLTQRLGLEAGIPALILSLSLATPFLFKQHILTIALLILGVGVWLVTGYFTGTLLYA
jgi:hypothetical protein